MTIRPPRVQIAADHPIGALRRPHRNGALVRLRRGAYVPADSEADLAGQILDRCTAVARQLRIYFAFSHQTAALLHGLPIFDRHADTVHVIQPNRPSGTQAADLVRHRVRELPTSDVASLYELPVTTLERTVLDCARGHPPAHALAVADAALRRLSGTTRFNWPGPAELEQQIRDRWRSRIEEMSPARGVVRARAVLAHADGRAESPAESQVRCLALAEGFLPPQLQARVSTTKGIYYPDLLWSGDAVRSNWRAVAVEYDGVAKYEAPEDLYAEKVREDALRSAGCLVIRATKVDLRDPRRLLGDLRTNLTLDPEAAQLRRALRAVW